MRKNVLGGDEVSLNWWASNPNITQWMKTNNVTTYAKLEEYWIKNIFNISEKNNFGMEYKI